MTDERFARAAAFEREILRTTSSRVEPCAFGVAFLQEAFPRRYSSNLLWIDPDARPSSAVAVADEAERVLGGAGLSHRKVVAGGALGRRLAPGLLELGWSADHLLVMALERGPDRPASVPVREARFADVRPLLEEGVRRAEPDADEETVRQLVAHRRLLEERVGARFFVSRVDDRDAGVCELYAARGVAQIEDVETLEELRGRGAARAAVLAAARAARADGADLVFLVADDDDWPKELYRRLGFDAVGDTWEFTRAPTP